MQRALTLLSCTFGCLAAFAQVSYTYHFATAPFTSSPEGGPTLQPIDTVVTPVVVTIPYTTCADTPTVSLSHFGHNSGFKAHAFFTSTYSVEMIFRFDELFSYKRILDFSNGLSDNGIYTFYDCLNFYPTGNIGICPGAFDVTNYRQLVITRNGSTKDMRVYVNDSLFTTFNDAADHYVIGDAPNDSIKFFKDDNVVINEDVSGNVALIRLADYELSPGAVAGSYQDFCAHITTGIAQHVAEPIFNVHPNPNNGTFSIDLPVGFGEVALRVFDGQGMLVHQRTLRDGTTTLNLGATPAGIYHLEMTKAFQRWERTMVVN